MESQSLFGRAVRTLRRKHGLSQTELAVRAATNQRYISELETGVKSGPTQQMVYRLSIGLHADLWEADLLHMAAGYKPLAPHWQVLTADEIEALLADLEKEFPGDPDDLVR